MVAECRNVGTSYPCSGVVVAIVVGDLPPLVPCLLAIVCDHAKYFVWQQLFLPWVEAYCRSIDRGTHGLRRTLVLLGRRW